MKKQFLLGLMAMTLPLTSWAQSTFTVTVGTANKVDYAGTNTENSASVVVKVGDKVLTKDQDFTYYFNKDVKNVGEYTVTVKGLGDYVKFTDATQKFNVTPKKVEKVTLLDVTKTYGTADADVDLTNYVTVEEGVLAAGDDRAELVKCLKLVRLRDTEKDLEDAGSVIKVYVESEDKEGNNYQYTFTQGADIKDLTIEAAPLTIKMTGKTYDAKVVKPSDFTANDYEITGGLKSGDAVEIEFANSASGEIKNAGTYNLKATSINNNYIVTGTVEYKIGRATLEITPTNGPESLTKVYDGKDIGEVTKLYTITTGNTETKESLKLTMVAAAGTAVNKYNVHPYVDGNPVWSGSNGGYEEPTLLPNYKIEYDRDNLKFAITAQTVKYHIEGGTEEYTGSAVNASGKVVYEVEGEEEFTVDNTPVIAFDEEDDVINVNDEGYKLKLTTEPAKANYEFELNAANNKNFKITPAALTIGINDQVKDFGEITEENYAKTLTNWMTYSAGVVTLKGAKIGADGQALRKVFKLTLTPEEGIENIGESGKYTIGIEWIEDDLLDPAGQTVKKNYTYDEEVTGTLTIKGVEMDFVFDGKTGEATGDEEEENATIADLLTKYNSAEIQKVTINNLMNYVGIQKADGGQMYQATTKFIEERYYMLTLPFDVRVRDLCQQLNEYTIVYVPNKEKTEAEGQAYFKLEMKTVPANTLMLFRVDETVDNFEGLEFEGVKIVAPNEVTKNVTEYGKVGFVSVYESETITGEKDWFLWPDNSNFYAAEWFVTSGGQEGMTVYPFNGYIHFENPSNARIFIEGADGTTTAINAITGEVVKENAEGWYTVGGMKLNAQPTQKGVYINNGKKIVIK